MAYQSPKDEGFVGNPGTVLKPAGGAVHAHQLYDNEVLAVKLEEIIETYLRAQDLMTIDNVKELIEKLYTTFVNDSETQKVITDLISISETFQNLSNEDFITVIKENVNKINQCNKEKEQEKIRNLYKSANDDEIEALKIQMQLRDKINNRLKLEKMNE